MRASQWFSATLRETPGDAEIVSHQLMLRAGMIRKLGAGLYSWLPLGLKVLRRVEQVVREEMNASLALEVLMPAVQPAELWKETGRWETFGGQLLTMTDSNDREYCYGPTHEEVITDIVRNELRSYKQLPLNFYQIQTKFRDEIRPRFGVMRAREFIMKDSYSFHLSQTSLQQTYDKMYQTYCKIFDRLGLSYRAVEADTGAIGGAYSHEFQVLADSGEDIVFYSDKSAYAANVEQAQSLIPPEAEAAASLPAMEEVDTKDKKTIAEVAEHLQLPASDLIKTLIVEGRESPMVALVLRGDDELNEVKAAKHPLVKSPLVFVDETTILKAVGAPIGSIGPVGLSMPILVDYHARAMASMVCGANKADKHLKQVAWNRDLPCEELAFLRKVKEGDKSPDGEGILRSCRGIEVGHIFQLGDKYAKAMGASIINEEGHLQTLIMGCYGLGISRIVAAAIEQHYDDKGIIWPESMAPFQLVIVPINAHRDEKVRTEAEKIYEDLRKLGVDVLLEDRNERPGVLFADNELIGIPHRIVVSERHLQQGSVEYKSRRSDEISMIPLQELSQKIQQLVKA